MLNPRIAHGLPLVRVDVVGAAKMNPPDSHRNGRPNGLLHGNPMRTWPLAIEKKNYKINENNSVGDY